MVDSFYAQYLRERTDDEIIETERGFVTYRYIGGDTVYIVDIWVRPAYREIGEGAKLADMVIEIARARGCKQLLGTVNPHTKNATKSLKVMLGYGMQLLNTSNDGIFLRKDI